MDALWIDALWMGSLWMDALWMPYEWIKLCYMDVHRYHYPSTRYPLPVTPFFFIQIASYYWELFLMRALRARITFLNRILAA